MYPCNINFIRGLVFAALLLAVSGASGCALFQPRVHPADDPDAVAGVSQRLRFLASTQPDAGSAAYQTILDGLFEIPREFYGEPKLTSAASQCELRRAALAAAADAASKAPADVESRNALIRAYFLAQESFSASAAQSELSQAPASRTLDALARILDDLAEDSAWDHGGRTVQVSGLNLMEAASATGARATKQLIEALAPLKALGSELATQGGDGGLTKRLAAEEADTDTQRRNVARMQAAAASVTAESENISAILRRLDEIVARLNQLERSYRATAPSFSPGEMGQMFESLASQMREAVALSGVQPA